MKKSAIALAVASAMSLSATAVAETTFYGSVRATVTYTEPAFISGSTWDVGDGGTRWGVRGSQDLGNGLSAIYHIETELDADNYNGGAQKGRLAWVGLKGGFGAVKLGAQWSPYYNVGGRADIFNDAGWYSLYQGPFRINDTVLYETPDSITSVKGEVAIVMDGERAGGADINEWQVGVNTSFGPFGGGVAYRSTDGGNAVLSDPGDPIERADDVTQWIVAASVDFAGASIAAMYENTDVDGNDDLGVLIDGASTFYLTAQYTIGNNILKAGYGKLDPGGSNDVDNNDEWALGIQHNLNKRTRLWLEYSNRDEYLPIRNPDTGRLTGADSDDRDYFSLGLRHDF